MKVEKLIKMEIMEKTECEKKTKKKKQPTALMHSCGRSDKMDPMIGRKPQWLRS